MVCLVTSEGDPFEDEVSKPSENRHYGIVRLYKVRDVKGEKEYLK